ncbi:MAG TPA: hypothetical protein VHI77_10180 [Solirubrobacterales bacterium]|nr:hypothetical protein [Solirubrobacterales bacterium]
MAQRQFLPGPSAQPEETRAAPAATPALQASMRNDQCPSCGVQMSRDQRYCLECGGRRGDPRLPFMDAVVFMEAVKQPQGGPAAAAAPAAPPPEKRSRMSANASLIAGVATLVLAIGVGVLIGRTGNESGSTASNTPSVIKVEGGAGGGAETATSEGARAESTATGGSAKPGKASKSAAKAKASTGSSGTSKATEEVFKPKSGIKLPPPTAKKGASCEEGTAGCEGGKFEGNFFE